MHADRRRAVLLRALAGALVLLACGLGCAGADDDDEPSGSAGSGSAGSGSGGSVSSGNDFLGSCDTRTVAGPSVGQCRDWIGNGNADLSVSCGGLEGEFSATMPCPADARVGTCTLDPVLRISAVYGYYPPDYTLEDAEDHCGTLGGAFAP